MKAMKAQWVVIAAVLMGVWSGPARAIDAEHREKAKQIAAKAITELRKQQGEDGSWTPKPGPAVTGMVIAAMLQNGVPKSDPAIQKGLKYILSKRKDNGLIYDSLLPNYNTSISLMALAFFKDDPKIEQAIRKAHEGLRKLQNGGDENHPHFGGQGYGSHGRPDLSNTAIMLAGLHDAGIDCKDPAFQDAMKFISQLQGSRANTKNGDKIEPGGGFIYAPSTDKDNVGNLESKGGETKDSTGSQRLRTYGSMTYAGFMSYLYAELERSDVRVQDAYRWIRNNYTLERNPGLPTDQTMEGYFYYLHLMSRALDAWRRDPATGKTLGTTIETADGKTRDWGNDLVDKLASIQQANGLWQNSASRWMEKDPVLCTAYALQAIGHAISK